MNTCHECGTEIPLDHDYCSPGCASMAAEDARSWTPEAAAIAEAAVVLVRRDPSRCLACEKQLPAPTGRRGRPRKTCDAACAATAKRTADRRRMMHDRVRFTTDPETGAGLVAWSDLDAFTADDGEDERDLFGGGRAIRDARPAWKGRDVADLRREAEQDRLIRAAENMEDRREWRRRRLCPETRALLARRADGAR
jgi:hypothetical protein